MEEGAWAVADRITFRECESGKVRTAKIEVERFLSDLFFRTRFLYEMRTSEDPSLSIVLFAIITMLLISRLAEPRSTLIVSRLELDVAERQTTFSC